MHVLGNTYNAIGVVLLLRWSGKNKFYNVKKMVKIIIVSGIITILITVIGDYTASFFNLPTPTPALTLIWIFSIFFVIKKYRMIEISPYTVPIEIMNSMEDTIALFNPDRSLNWFNKTDDDVFNKIILSRKNLLSIFSDNFNVVSMISELKNGEQQSAAFRYPCRINNDIYLYDIVIKNLHDSFGDNMGYLLKAKRIKSVEFLGSMFRITKRELEVIKLLLTGLTYQDLSANINISENTLKTHISSLYGKLGINNKVELINLVNKLEKL
jgi:DNA-binding CsgD family transcriptional regulator